MRIISRGNCLFLILFIIAVSVQKAGAQTSFGNSSANVDGNQYQIPTQDSGKIERRSLAPLDPSQNNYGRTSNRNLPTGLPMKSRGELSLSEFRSWSSKITLPVSSSALHELLLRTYLAEIDNRARVSETETYQIKEYRLNILFRAGRFQDIINLSQNRSLNNTSPALQTFFGWSLLALGKIDKACDQARQTQLSSPLISREGRALALMLNSYCYASQSEFEAALHSADLAGEQGADVQIPNTILYRLITGEKSRLEVPDQFTLIDYAFLRLTKWQPHPALFEMSDTPMLVAISHDPNVPELIRLQALEKAAKRKATMPRHLSELYSVQKLTEKELDIDLTNSEVNSRLESIRGSKYRALIYQAIERASRPQIKARLISIFLNNGRKEGIYKASAEVVVPFILALPQSHSIVDYAEIFVEALAVTHQYKQSADWAIFASASRQNATDNGLLHWLILIDIAENDSSISSDRALQIATGQARRGKFSNQILHRLISVLDALNYKISIPLWDIASRNPQPTGGYLPKTGHLSHLMGAANRGNSEKTMYMAIQALGPEGPSKTHIIALSDSIRALVLAGFQAEARQVAFEALIDLWPRRRSS